MNDRTRQRGPGHNNRATDVLDQLHDGIRSRFEKFRQSGLQHQQHTQVFADILAALTRLHHISDERMLLEEAARTIATLGGVAGVLISALRLHNRTRFELIASHGLTPGEPDDLTFPADSPLVAAAREAGNPLIVSEMVGTLGPRSKQRAVLRGLDCEVVFPLVRGSRILGLVLLTGHPEGRRLTAGELGLLEPYMACLALTLENLLLRAACMPESGNAAM
jgi:hypothetical protein